MALSRFILITLFLLFITSVLSPHKATVAAPVSAGIQDYFGADAETSLQSRTHLPLITNNKQPRHPDAGVWVAYKGDNTAADLSKPHIKGVMAYVAWNDIYTGKNSFNWEALDTRLELAINKAGKKSFVEVTAGYCPNLEWPTFMRNQIAAHKEANNQGCKPLQFWDPIYIQLYKNYIKALANHLADFDASDIRPNQTDIIFVRANVMAETMENLPNDYSKWRTENFHAAPNGRLYNVDLTEKIAYDYQREIVLYYKQELNRAYQRKGLSAPVPVAKAGLFGGPTPNRNFFAEQGIWFDKHSGSPNPEGWYFDMVQTVREGLTRGTSESGNNWPRDLLSQYNHWESLALLHSGLEFIGIYGNNKRLPQVQPKGAVNFPENREALNFINKYAGYLRHPSSSPGAWVALRGAYPEDEWSKTLRHDTIWTNYEFLLTQYRPQDSVLLWSLEHNFDRTRRMVPIVRRDSKDPWSEDITFCRKQYSEQECEFLQQSPDTYLGQSGGSYLFTFANSNLGDVLYCGTDAFCEDRSRATRKEEMIWARRTDKRNGNNHMRFDLDNAFANSLGKKAEIRIVYLDRGTGKWQLQYDSTTNASKSAIVIQKRDTNLWKEVIIRLNDVNFQNRQEGGTDLALYNMGDDDDLFHIIEVMRIGGGSATPPPTPTPGSPPVATPGPQPNATATPVPSTEPPSATTTPGSPDQPPGATTTPGSPDQPPTATPRPDAPPQGPLPSVDPSVFLEQGGQVVMEAEHYTAQRPGTGRYSDILWRIQTIFSGFTGNAALQAQPNRNHNTRATTAGPSLLYWVKFSTPGDYYIFVRGLGPASDSNSIHVGLNGNPILQSENGMGWPEDTQFSWRRGPGGAESRLHIPTPGTYTINIWMREDGTIIDKIMLNLSGRVIASGSTESGPTESERMPIPDNNPPPSGPSNPAAQTNRIWIPFVSK